MRSPSVAKENGQESQFNHQISYHKFENLSRAFGPSAVTAFNTVKGVAPARPLRSWSYQEDGMSPNLPQGGEAAKLDRKQLLGGGVFVNNTAFRGTWEQQFKKRKKR